MSHRKNSTTPAPRTRFKQSGRFSNGRIPGTRGRMQPKKALDVLERASKARVSDEAYRKHLEDIERYKL